MPVDAVRVLCTCAVVLCVTAVLLLRRTRAVPEAPYVSKGPRKVVLLGVEEAGKTNVFLRMVMGVAPDTTTSQRVNAARLSPSDACPHGIELVDTPGHARLRAQAMDAMRGADAVVFCIDASVASRGANEPAPGMSSTHARPSLHEALQHSVDYLHDVLHTLAADVPPQPLALSILFTRMDASPLFSDRAMLADDKRRQQLLARCRRGLETAFMSRRETRGLSRTDAAGRVVVGEIGDIRGDASLRERVWGRMRQALVPLGLVPAEARTAAELHPTRWGHKVRAGEGHQRSAEYALDYMVARRGAGAEAPFQCLDPRLVQGGCAAMGLGYVDRHGWDPTRVGEAYLPDVHAWLSPRAS